MYLTRSYLRIDLLTMSSNILTFLNINRSSYTVLSPWHSSLSSTLYEPNGFFYHDHKLNAAMYPYVLINMSNSFRFLFHWCILLETKPNTNILILSTHKKHHIARKNGSWPDPKQWVIIDNYNLMMLTRWSTNILTINNKKNVWANDTQSYILHII